MCVAYPRTILRWSGGAYESQKSPPKLASGSSLLASCSLLIASCSLLKFGDEKSTKNVFKFYSVMAGGSGYFLLYRVEVGRLSQDYLPIAE